MTKTVPRRSVIAQLCLNTTHTSESLRSFGYQVRYHCGPVCEVSAEATDKTLADQLANLWKQVTVSN